jgi:hypothetical protein
MQMDFGTASVIERAGNYYWARRGSDAVHGTFNAPIDAIADMEADELADGDDNYELDDAEFGVGAAAWIDPDSGHIPGATILHLEDIY